MLVSLHKLLPSALSHSYALAGFNVFGYEEARCVLEVAEERREPVLLLVNRSVIAYFSLELIGELLLSMARKAAVPVVVHLDHQDDFSVIYRALRLGFSSVMYDGSALPLAENIKNTKQVVAVAQALGASVEGEVGSVRYAEGRAQVREEFSEPGEVSQFCRETGVDAVAISVGTVHRERKPGARIDYDRLAAIEKETQTPLVIHGTTSLFDADLRKLSRTQVCKFNIGTALRMEFGTGLREAMAAAPGEFDRWYFFERVFPRLKKVIHHKMSLIGR